MNTVPVLETDAEIVAAIREKKVFNSSVLSARQGDLAYVLSHKGEDIAFICSHGELYINLDPSARRMYNELMDSSANAEAVEELFMKCGTLIHNSWEGGRETIVLCDLDKFAVVCAIHGIQPDEYIVDNLRDRGLLLKFLAMALKIGGGE
jgi:hypothetical protein